MAEKINLDSLFTDEDREDLAQIQNIRRHILKNIGINNFINMMREIIDDSEKFEFTSATKRKFININTPIFTIRKIDYKPDQKLINNDKYINSEISNITSEINKDILSHTTKKILDFIQTDEHLKEIYSNINEDLKDLIWTTVFEIRCSIKDNIIYIRYCI